HLSRRSDLPDLARREDDDAIAERERLVVLMGDEDRPSRQRIVRAADLIGESRALRRVEARERLVEKEVARALRERASERHPAPLAARKERGAAFDQVADPEALCYVPGSLARRGLSFAARAQPERDLVEDAKVRLERRILEDHRDPSITGRDRFRGPAIDHDFAGRGDLEPGEEPQERRLSAA